MALIQSTFFNSILIFNDVKSEVDMKSTNMDLDYSTQNIIRLMIMVSKYILKLLILESQLT